MADPASTAAPRVPTVKLHAGGAADHRPPPMPRRPWTRWSGLVPPVAEIELARA